MNLTNFKKTEMGRHMINSTTEDAVHYLRFNLVYGPQDSQLWDVYSRTIKMGRRLEKTSHETFIRILKIGTVVATGSGNLKEKQ